MWNVHGYWGVWTRAVGCGIESCYSTAAVSFYRLPLDMPSMAENTSAYRSSPPVTAGGPGSSIDESGGRIRCVCGRIEDDGFTIQCETCLVWQHACCVGISKAAVPEEYFCEVCRPELHRSSSPTSDELEGLDSGESGVDSFGGSPKGRKGKTKDASGMALMVNLNEISENIVSGEALPEIRAFVLLYESARLKTPTPTATLPEDYYSVNFEFASTIALPSTKAFESAKKKVEVREIRNRGYQKKPLRFGLYAQDLIDPGCLIIEFLGHVQKKSSLLSNPLLPSFEASPQALILFPPREHELELVIDARRFGNAARYVRRSCRPSAEIKPVLVAASSENNEDRPSFHLCLFAKNTLYEGDEITIAHDYDAGNRLFKYDCACGAPEFCLMVEPSNQDSHRTNNSNSGQSSMNVDKVELGFEEMISRPASALPSDRKLTREERKLQQYIDLIERMDGSKKGSRKTSTATSRIGSSSPTNSPSPKRAKKGHATASPKKSFRASPPADTRINTMDKASKHLGIKKMWMQSYLRKLEERFEDQPKATSIATAVAQLDRHDDHGPSHQDEAMLPARSDSVVSDVFVDIESVEAMPTTIDVGSDFERAMTPVTQMVTEDQTEETSPDPTSSPAPEISSKKRVSLSDYLKKRRESPTESSSNHDEKTQKPYEEGEVLQNRAQQDQRANLSPSEAYDNPSFSSSTPAASSKLRESITFERPDYSRMRGNQEHDNRPISRDSRFDRDSTRRPYFPPSEGAREEHGRGRNGRNDYGKPEYSSSRREPRFDRDAGSLSSSAVSLPASAERSSHLPSSAANPVQRSSNYPRRTPAVQSEWNNTRPDKDATGTHGRRSNENRPYYRDSRPPYNENNSYN